MNPLLNLLTKPLLAGALTLSVGALMAAPASATGSVTMARPTGCYSNVWNKWGAMATCSDDNGGSWRAIALCKSPSSGKLTPYYGPWRSGDATSIAYCGGDSVASSAGFETRVY
ncbi:hypothetical protein HD597_012935 [Nonomuraea thailandensis]|uniref:Uncharacterized protein n=1 Tax=Nonomuraea thailandensis TaxID=1188745 RepID=A0A9X2KD82_9ACTN|nr:hypothetical protein [Nonomuraea thailandensis]